MTRPLLRAEIVAVGDAMGVVLPDAVLVRLGVGRGDAVSVVETPDGLEIRRYEPAAENELATAREVMRRRAAALRELAR